MLRQKSTVSNLFLFCNAVAVLVSHEISCSTGSQNTKVCPGLSTHVAYVLWNSHLHCTFQVTNTQHIGLSTSTIVFNPLRHAVCAGITVSFSSSLWPSHTNSSELNLRRLVCPGLSARLYKHIKSSDNPILYSSEISYWLHTQLYIIGLSSNPVFIL